MRHTKVQSNEIAPVLCKTSVQEEDADFICSAILKSSLLASYHVFQNALDSSSEIAFIVFHAVNHEVFAFERLDFSCDDFILLFVLESGLDGTHLVVVYGR